MTAGTNPAGLVTAIKALAYDGSSREAIPSLNPIAPESPTSGCESMLTALIEESHDLIVLADRNGEVLHINPAGKQLIGLSGSTAWHGVRIMDFPPMEDRALFPTQIWPLLSRDGVWRGRGRLRHFLTGRVIPSIITIIGVPDEHTGYPVLFAMLCRESPDSAIEPAGAPSAPESPRPSDTPPRHVSIMNMETGRLECASPARGILGRVLRPGAAPEAIIDLTVPDDRPAARRFVEGCRRGAAEAVDIRVSDPPGERLLELRSHPCPDPDGRLRRVVVMAEDLTRRRMAELQSIEDKRCYRLLVENGPTAMAVVQDGRFVFGNRRWEELFGSIPKEEADDLAADIPPAAAPDAVARDPFTTCDPSPDAAPVLFRIVDRRGITHWLDARGAPIVWNDRPAWLVFYSDVSARVRSEEERDQHDRVLEALVRERTRLAEQAIQKLLGEIGERDRVEAELRRGQENLMRVDAERMMTEERQRRQIAADLHDNIAQCLAAATLRLKMLRRSTRDPETAEGLDEAVGLMTVMTGDLRDLIQEISPPVLHDLGLASALSWLAEVTGRQGGPAMEVVLMDATTEPDFEIRVTLFRVVRDLLQHFFGAARAAQVRLTYGSAADGLVMAMQARPATPGAPAFPAPDSLAASWITGLQSRLTAVGGSLTWELSPNTGVTFLLRAPFGFGGRGN